MLLNLFGKLYCMGEKKSCYVKRRRMDVVSIFNLGCFPFLRTKANSLQSAYIKMKEVKPSSKVIYSFHT